MGICNVKNMLKMKREPILVAINYLVYNYDSIYVII